MSSSNLLLESQIYTEAFNDDPPTQDDIEEFAKRIGIDVAKESNLLYLAREGLEAKLPDHWRPCLDKIRDAWYYYNEETQQSQWEHPMNPIYRDKVTQARADLAMNRIQNFDPLTSRPPKSLPPLKKGGGSLAPINAAAVGSLGKLGGLRPGSAAVDLRPAGGQLSANTMSRNGFDSAMNSKPAGRASANIISSSSLNPIKDMDGDESPPLVRPQPRKIGLTLTGGGANFLKGSSSDKSSRDRGGGDNNMSDTDSGALDKKPYKSILVNSHSRSRPTNDNVYELDGFSINPDEMTDNEKRVFSQLESTSSKSKGNVKFNLDENTELKFEMSGDEDDEFDANEDTQNRTDGDVEGTDEESVVSGNEPQDSAVRNYPDWTQNGPGDTLGSRLFQSKPRIDPTNETKKKEEPLIPEYSEDDITAMRKAMREEMEEELRKFKEELEEERKSRQGQIQKHMEETVAQFKSEKEETVRRIKKELENEKVADVDKAKREIDALLQTEIEALRSRFEEMFKQRQKELETEHEKKIEDLVNEYKRKDEEVVSEALRRQASEESVRADMEYKKQKEVLREEHLRQLAHARDYHKTILDRLKADLQADEEQLRHDNSLRRAELAEKFEQETETLKRKLGKQQEEMMAKIKEEFDEKQSAMEKSLNTSLQDIKERISQAKRSVSETNILDKASEDELKAMKIKYQQLEMKYQSLKNELQLMSTEMSTKRHSPIPESNNNKKKQDQSLRSGRHSPKIFSKGSVERKESFDISDTNPDSAHGSESNTDTNSSLYPSSGGGGRQDDSMSQTNRINAALQALETLKKEILDLKSSTSKKASRPQAAVDPKRLVPSKPIANSIVNNKAASARRPTKHDVIPPQHESSRSTRKKSNSSMSTPGGQHKSVRKVSPYSPPTRDHDDDDPPSVPPQFISRNVPTISQEPSTPHNGDPSAEDTHQRIVEEAKAFIRMQKNRLNDPSPIPSALHLMPKPKNNLLLFDEKLLKAATPRRPAAVHLDMYSETESSGVSSLKDHRSSESKKLSRDIDEICNSLNNLDHQMRLMWSVVNGKQQDESLTLLHATSDVSAMLPNAVPLILGKGPRASMSLPVSARKPVVPPASPVNNAIDDFPPSQLVSGKSYASLLATSPGSSSQTVLDALRMSGISTTRLDCSELLQSLEEELKEFKSTKQRLLDMHSSSGSEKRLSPRVNISSTASATSNSILEKAKDLQEWIKKY